MQKITPNLWFDGNAREAAQYYIALPGGEITSTEYYPMNAEEGLADFQLDMDGKELTVNFRLGDIDLTAINADKTSSFNPSLSFTVNFNAADDKTTRDVDSLWDSLSEDGVVIMPLRDYSFAD